MAGNMLHKYLKIWRALQINLVKNILVKNIKEETDEEKEVR